MLRRSYFYGSFLQLTILLYTEVFPTCTILPFIHDVSENSRNHHETTMKPCMKPLVIRRQIDETTYLQKKELC